MYLDTIQPDEIRVWKDVERWFEVFSADRAQWIFRGLKDAGKDCETTLERAIARLWGDAKALESRHKAIRRAELQRVLRRGPAGEQVSKVERRLLREFTRQYHHFSADSPEHGNALEWLSIMRHYGAPSRLLDFSYSWFVGLFFALEGASGESTGWAIDSDWADLEARKGMSPRARWLCKEDPQLRRPESSDAVLWAHRPEPAVIPLNPRRLNPRLVAQQGVFLCPLKVSAPFMENLSATLQGSKRRDRVRRFVIGGTTEARRELLRRLLRMNVSRATLFPGLDGFAQSLETYLATADSFGKSGDFHLGRWM